MLASKITYENKVGLKPKTVHVNQWWDDDANEVKTIVNEHADYINVFSFDLANKSFTTVGKTGSTTNFLAGIDAGRYIADGVTEITGATNSVAVGQSSKFLEDNPDNEIVIGHNTIGNGSNTTTIGNTATDKAYIRGLQGVEANAFIKTGATNQDVLLGDGTTTILSSIGGGKFIDGAVDPLKAVYMDGNVGINDNDPDSKLVVKGEAGVGTVLRVETSLGETTLEAYDNGLVTNSGRSTAAGNVLFGTNAAPSGINNTLCGSGAGGNITTGQRNTNIGFFAGVGTKTGSYNVHIGQQTGNFNFTGSSNTVVGDGASRLIATGDNNTIIGTEAGSTLGISSVSGAVILGRGSNVLTDNSSNEIVIGASNRGNGSNTATLGNNNITDTHLKGNVHVEATFPGQDLFEVITSNGEQSLKITNDRSTQVSGSSSTEDTAPLVVTQEDNVTLNMPLQSWYSGNSLVASMNTGGDFGFIDPFAAFTTGSVGVNRPQYNATGPQISMTGGSGINFYNNGTHFSNGSTHVAELRSDGSLGLGTQGDNNPVVTTLDSSAMLHIESTTKGFLPPRMTEAQRLAIVSPATGLHVYQTNGTEGVYVNKSTGWVLAY